jgi:hypothetical protein
MSPRKRRRADKARKTGNTTAVVKTKNITTVIKPDFKPQPYAGTQCPCFTGERRARRARVSAAQAPEPLPEPAAEPVHALFWIGLRSVPTQRI